MKVLIVDDSLVMRKLITTVLAKAGITDVVHAQNGLEAVSSTQTAQFDLILMDWNMPQMGGIEAVTQIRQSGIKTPIVMVTTEAEKERIIKALQAGATNYLIKPFEPEALISKIQSILGPS
jgi:two-component system, chemotaxis family, chemotaxis protein CheY